MFHAVFTAITWQDGMCRTKRTRMFRTMAPEVTKCSIENAAPESLHSLHVLFLINVWPLHSQKPFTVAIVIGHLVPSSQIGSQSTLWGGA